MTDEMKLTQALDLWLDNLKNKRARKTYETGKSAARMFVSVVDDVDLQSLNENHFRQLLVYLNPYAATTEKLYGSMIYLFYEYIVANDLSSVNIAKLRFIRRYESRRPGTKQRIINKKAIKQLIERLFDLEIPKDDLVFARSKALVILAVESGLRSFEFSGLRKNNLDTQDLYGNVIGKGNKDGEFSFTQRFVDALDYYFALRSRLEPKRGARVADENKPLFVSHSKRHAKKLKPIDSDTARADLKRILGIVFDKVPNVGIHDIRHFYINMFLEESEDLELTRKAARHSSILTTQKYLHKDRKKIKDVHKKIWEIK